MAPTPKTPINWASFSPVGREEEFLIRAFRSGWVSSGPFVTELETAVEKIFKSGPALAVANGTAALMLAFQTLDVKPGDRIIVPAFCFQAAANTLLQLGAEPVFCDIDLLNWNQSKATVAACLDDSISGIVVVHNYGCAAEVDQISQLAKEHGIWLVEDAAEAWFSKLNDTYLGCFGDISIFSMHATKTIACGEGGVVLVNRNDLVDKARLHRSHGLDRTAVQYMHLLPGNNYRLSNLLSALACAQLEEKDEILKAQRKRTKIYMTGFADVPNLRFQRSLGDAHDEHWADALYIDFQYLSITRNDLIALARDNGVELRPGFYPPSAIPYYNHDTLNPTPVSDRIAASTIVLPCASTLTPVQLEKVIEVITNLITENSLDPQSSYHIHQLDPNSEPDMGLLADLVQDLSQESSGFRYFSKRPLDVVKTHLYTCLLLQNSKAVGYGHLDPDNDTVWLGIAIAPEYTGKKLGRSIMQSLVEHASENKIERLDLLVDHQNPAALALYMSYGFTNCPDRTSDTAQHMTLSLPKN